MEQTKKKQNEVGNKLSDFEIIKELGKGSYGTVYTVKSLLNSNIYVMKKMELNYLNPRQQQECYREVSILKKVSHRNIIKYYSSFLDKEILYIIMEYAELGDLYSLIKHYKKHSRYFDEIDLWKISLEILNGLDYLHSQKIIHRDIKCLNLFITKDRHIKIGDLGVSTITSGMDNLHYTRVGTPLYISPELVIQKPYDFKTDIWSFGCSLYHLASLEPPFLGGNLIVLGNNIVKGVPKSLPVQYSNELRFFIDKMLEKKPENRPTAKEALDLIPKEIKEKIKSNGEKFQIKSKRPFSSAMNKIITVNKDEIRNLFFEKDKMKNKNEQNNIEDHNINNNNKNDKNDKNTKNNKNIFNNHSEAKVITIHNLEDKNNNNNGSNCKKAINKENELKINEDKKKDFQILFNSSDNNEENQKEKERENIRKLNKRHTDILQYGSGNNIVNSYNNDIKKPTDKSSETPVIKKTYDLSFNIPTFNNQRAFKNFRTKKKKSEELLSENKFDGFTLANKFKSNYNYLNLFSPLFKNQNLFKIKKNKIHFGQINTIEPSKNNNIKNLENKLNAQNNNNIEIIERIKNEKKLSIRDTNMNIINNENKNINIINIIQDDINKIKKNSNNKINYQEIKLNNYSLSSGKKMFSKKKDLMRLSTDLNKNKEDLKFPELNFKDKILNNYMKESTINGKSNYLYSYLNPSITKKSNEHTLYKKLNSTKTNSRSFSNRPLTTKVSKTKNFISYKNNFNINNDNYTNNNKNVQFYTKDNSQSETHQNFTENKTIKNKKTIFRPLTGIKPQINNNVMNININFYNIDMNKRFLIPEINPYYPSNEHSNNNDQLTEDSLLQTKKFKDNVINNMDLNSYRNSNEFLFQKIIKAIKDINGNNKRLTINDLN